MNNISEEMGLDFWNELRYVLSQTALNALLTVIRDYNDNKTSRDQSQGSQGQTPQ